MPASSLLVEAAILLGVGLVFVIFFRKLGLGAVLGFLVAGAVIGPHGLQLAGGGESKLAIAEIGIALLLFLVGLELNPARLWRLRRDIFGLGLVQVVVCGVALLLFVKLMSTVTWAAAVALGLPLALSSTAQVLPSLKASGRINTPIGERAFSILLFQDLAIVPLITIVAALSRTPASQDAPPGWQLAGSTILAIAGLVLAGRFIINPLLRLTGRLGERELFVFVGLFTVMAAAALMHSLHLSTALGAFVAGVMLADSPYRHEIEADVEPFRSILLGLFFLAVGMVLDIPAVLNRPVYVFLIALGLIVIKAGMIASICRFSGMAIRQAIGLGLLLSQGGEFGFVLFAQAQKGQLIEPQAASLFSAIVTLSMVATPFMLILARRLERPDASEGNLPLGPETKAGRGKAIIVGGGRFGQTVSQLLLGHGVSVTITDVKPAQIELSESFGAKVYYGDGRRVDLLHKAGAGDARLILFCGDDRDLGQAELSLIRHTFPQAGIFVRAFDRRQQLAIDDPEIIVVREMFESAIAMGIQALATLGASPDAIQDVEADFRTRDLRRLDAQRETGDMHARDEDHLKPE